jgi:hypothetical protein
VECILIVGHIGNVVEFRCVCVCVITFIAKTLHVKYLFGSKILGSSSNKSTK